MTSNPYLKPDRKWRTAPQISAPTPSEVRALIQEELAGGANAISLHLSTFARGIDNKCATCKRPCEGSHILDIEDVREALGGVINFENSGIYINTGYSSYPFIYLLYEGKSCFAKAVGGHVGGALFASFTEYSSLPRPISALYDEMAEALIFMQQNSPNIRTVIADSYAYVDGGADSITEIACVMAEVSEYMRALTARGIDPSSASKSIGLSISLGGDFFTEIAKIRAARILFARITKSFGASDEAQNASIHAKTSKFNKSKYDPYTNILRLSVESLSGVLGGADAITILPFDTPIGKADALSRRTSRSQALMLAEELGLNSMPDSPGSFYYLEKLTEEFAEKAFNKFNDYENAGGFYEALKKGMPQEEIAKNLAEMKEKLNTRQLCVIGTNIYANACEEPLIREPVSANPTKAPTGKDFDLSVEGIREAFKAGLTTVDIYPKITGLDHGGKCTPIRTARLTKDFESIREKTAALNGVSVLLLKIGLPGQYKAHADFSKSFFEAGGFTVNSEQTFSCAKEAVEGALKESPDICVICSSDDIYPELVPDIIGGIKAENTEIQIILAGTPASGHKNTYSEAGLTDFIHIHSNCLEALQNIQKRIIRDKR